MSHPSTNQLITFLTTDKFVETISFVEDQLGFPLALEKAHCRIYRIAPRAYVALCKSDEPMPDAKRVTVSIQSNDIDGWYEKVNSQNLKTDGEPRWSEAYGIYHFFTWDPSGYSWEFQEFRLDDWDHDA